MSLEKQLLRKVGQAVHDFQMIREGDRIAVGVSGGKDSLTLLEALRLLQRRSPVRFELQAFTVEQGKFRGSIEEPLTAFMKEREMPWTYYKDQASLQLLEEQPDHGCDMCSRYRRRAVYEIAASLGANVVALGHTADDFCESLLRNTMYTGRLSALPASTHSRSGDFRLIRPLVYVNEEITAAYAAENAIPLTPCVCSERSGTVRLSIRDFLRQAREENPHVLENMLSAMSRIDDQRLLDRRFLDFGEAETADRTQPDNPFPVLVQEMI